MKFSRSSFWRKLGGAAPYLRNHIPVHVDVITEHVIECGDGCCIGLLILFICVYPLLLLLMDVVI